MHRHVARVLAVAVCLAAAGDGERSAHSRSSRFTSSEATQSTPLERKAPLICKGAQGVDFKHYYMDDDDEGVTKSVLKIRIKDDYNFTVLPPAPTTPPPPPPPTAPPSHPPTQPPSLPPSPLSHSTLPSPKKTTQPTTTIIPRTTNKSSSTNTNIPVTSSSATFVESQEDDDDWDYIEGLVPDSKEDQQVLDHERARHQISAMVQEYEKHKKDMQLFCAEAAKEDDTVIESDGSFHPRYEEVPGVGVYRLHARPRPWEEARRVCEREGAQLAVPKSRAEALALAEIHNRCPRLLPTHFNDYQYLGVHDLYSEGDWETVVGYPLNETGYVNWAMNQPDNAHEHGENCLTMNRNGFYNDVPCWTELPFICEHP